MNVWLVQIGEALPVKAGIRKLRTAYLAEKLVQRGHDVLWWASAFDHFKKCWLYSDDTELTLHQKLRIKALRGLGYKRNVSLSRYVDHRFIARKFRKAAPRLPKPDIIVASMPSHDLAYEAVTLAAKNRIPVLVDVRDQWPDIFLNQFPFLLKSLARIALRKDYMMTKKALRLATGIISVSTDFFEWGLTYASREQTWKDKVFYLGYKRGTSGVQQSKIIDKTLRNLKDKFVISFIGTFAEYHNPSILVECADKLKDNNNIHFVLAGDGQLMPKMKELSVQLSNLTLTGWLNQVEIDALLTQSDIGVCTTNQTAYLFPNKALAYFSAGLPIISAFQGELKEIAEKHHIGLYYPPNDVSSLVACIEKLYKDTGLYRMMSERVCKAFNEMFDADKIYDEYSRHIEAVANPYKGKR